MAENNNSPQQDKGEEEKKMSSLVRKFPKKNLKTVALYVLSALLVVGAGIGSGWYLSGGQSSGVLGENGDGPPKTKTGAKEAGIADESTFRDTADGILETGGVDGEGTHHLVREGGPSQYVYLTSTVIDLDSFVGKNVQVWGETIAAQQAGWLMDVGKIKVLE